ncbi:MAG: flagellar M-ring protein FliF [Planctomycetes bacterium]|nr:flagellar M-ring protein FliF [Planctomycetota bacterium]
MSIVSPVMENFGELWRHTNLVQRVMVTAIVLACIGAAGLLMVWARQPQYSLLYRGLSPEEAAKIVEKCSDDGIAYKLKEGGTAVYVASDKVYKMRLKMAGEGLPRGGHDGYSILDQGGVGQSPYIQKINRIRAIEGELAMTIESMDAVAKARVHIVPAESGLFGGTERKATASVQVQLIGGRSPSPRYVASIVHLIAGGVEGLSPENVTVTDTKGNLLTSESGGVLAKSVQGVLDHKAQVEEYLSRKVQSMLEAVLGVGRVSVRVAVEIDTTSKEQTVETPSEGAVSSEKVVTTKTTPIGDKKAASGTSSETKNFEYRTGLTILRTNTLPGKVLSKSVSCFVDLSSPESRGSEGGGAAPHPVMKIEDVQTMIVEALGLKITGDGPDSVKVFDTPFYKNPELAKAQASMGDEGMFTPDFILQIAKRISLGILVTGVVLALKIVRKSGGGAAVTVEGQQAQSSNLLTAGSAGAGAAGRGAMRAQITQALQQNPEEVKRLFRSWIQGEQGGA